MCVCVRTSSTVSEIFRGDALLRQWGAQFMDIPMYAVFWVPKNHYTQHLFEQALRLVLVSLLSLPVVPIHIQYVAEAILVHEV